jgi:hypothetical protein
MQLCQGVSSWVVDAIVARNNVSNRIGHYDKGTGTTRDKFGNRLTHGNILASLIMDGRKRE